VNQARTPRINAAKPCKLSVLMSDYDQIVKLKKLPYQTSKIRSAVLELHTWTHWLHIAKPASGIMQLSPERLKFQGVSSFKRHERIKIKLLFLEGCWMVAPRLIHQNPLNSPFYFSNHVRFKSTRKKKVQKNPKHKWRISTKPHGRVRNTAAWHSEAPGSNLRPGHRL
jgi:hypothetical protein